jgi:predicted kinase
MKRPKLYILVGLPAAGKSSWIAVQPFDWTRTVVASSDGHIERYAKSMGQTYSDVFKDYASTAMKLMHADVSDAIEKGYDIIWDQTNVNAKTRASKLKAVPDNYEKIAVMFATPEDKEHIRRLNNRPGKHIPPEVIANMKAQLEVPSEEEGFDKIIFADNTR